MKFLIFAGILATNCLLADAGYPGFLCPASLENNATFFPCNADCKHQHGAEEGVCGPMSRGDYNCYCGRTDQKRTEESLHCAKETGSFAELCVVDCQCSHGAVTGVCDFDRKFCKCLGRDPYNTYCKFPDPAEFAEFTAGIVSDDSPAWLFLKYFVTPPVKCAVSAPLPPVKSSSGNGQWEEAIYKPQKDIILQPPRPPRSDKPIRTQVN